MPKNSRAEFIVRGNNLSAAYIANAAELPGLDGLHRELSTVLNELTDLGIQQEAQTAAVQQTTLEINDRLTRGKLLVTRLRNGVRSHLGTRTEKVIAFGIRPFRKPVREPKVIVKEVPAKSAATDTTNPTT
ncbi:MAG TPA: hypothetical protein VKM72_33400 [Thermoanaerobaculia bacterium]|nr:hypothetical protein [Thermoanaerobaculia bacterium]